MPRDDPGAAVSAIQAALPGFDVRTATPSDTGWDAFVVEVNGSWIFRFARDENAARTFRMEAALLPHVAPVLPAPVPLYVHVVEEPAFFVAYRKIDGFAPRPDGPGLESGGRDLGRFLAALHAFPVEQARSLGVPGGDASDWRDEQEALVGGLTRRVLPLLPSDMAERAAAAFRAFLDEDSNFAFEPALIHYDVGPGNLLFDVEGRLSGVLDWSDAAIGDPAADLAWALHGAEASFAAAVRASYPADPALERRARFFHAIGPWHEVVHGQDTHNAGWIETGLEGVLSRLR